MLKVCDKVSADLKIILNILVFRITEPEFARVRNYGSYSTPYDTQSQQPVYTAPKPGTGGAVRVRGLPYSCKQNELISFFQGKLSNGFS